MPKASKKRGIAEMADLTGLSRDTLRWYEREGLIPHVDRDHNGHRSYDDRAVVMVQLLVRLRRTGMPVARMRRYVELVMAGESTHPERLELLRRHRESVRGQLDQLTSDLDVLDRKIGVYQHLIEEKERE
ncbi:MAG: MerR family transcriptional regulator [Arachnia propionica]|uniref:MerR family transcriptional regulator n=1 Tax=Arachnia propionica TaxID=1750 RepID=UPI0026F98EC1|nr:MerR family transcriptional regulator [Arachnia propionica]